jgi:hypothetical protein
MEIRPEAGIWKGGGSNQSMPLQKLTLNRGENQTPGGVGGVISQEG